MLTFAVRPAFLDDFSVAGFTTEIQLGAPGRFELTLRPLRNAESHLDHYLRLQRFLGTEVQCQVDGMEFHGWVDWVASAGVEGGFTVVLGDALARLGRRFGSRVFANQTVGDICRSLLDVPYRIDEAVAHLHQSLAVQHQESDLSFLQRVVHGCGARLWCAEGEVFVVDGASEAETEIHLGRDCVDYRLRGGLAPEKVTGIGVDYREHNHVRPPSSLVSEQSYGPIQDATREARASSADVACLYAVQEDDRYGGLDRRSLSLLRTFVSTRLILDGELRAPLAPGTFVKVVAESGSQEDLVITALCGRQAPGSEHVSWKVEARCPESLLSTVPTTPTSPMVSTAIVEDADDPDHLNRARVRFCWDKERNETPWLRIVGSCWGEGHCQYTPPKVGDTVLVIWGQSDTDAVILGALSAGQMAPSPDSLFVFKTQEGQTIEVGQESIVLRNESKKSIAELKVDSDALTLTTDTGRFVKLCGDSIVLEYSPEVRMELSRRGLVVRGDVEFSNAKGGCFELKGNTVSINQDALVVV